MAQFGWGREKAAEALRSGRVRKKEPPRPTASEIMQQLRAQAAKEGRPAILRSVYSVYV